MAEGREKTIEVNVHDSGSVIMALDNSQVEVQQDIRKSGKKALLIIIFSVGIICALCLIFYHQYTTDNGGIHNNALFQKAKELQKQGQHLEAAVVYNELYGSLPKAKEEQVEEIKFWEAYAYFSHFLFSEGSESQYGYRAFEIFEKIANTKNEENEDFRLMSMGCLILLSINISDVDYEEKVADYCPILEEAMINYHPTGAEDYNTYNTRTVAYYALAEYYKRQFTKGIFEEDSLAYLEIMISYYQKALDNCRGMMECENGVFDSKRTEIILLKNLSVYYPMFYLITKEDKYLSAAEVCFDELQAKVDLNTDVSTYIDSMRKIASGKILIGGEESLEEAYEILHSLFYYVCKDEEQLCEIGSYMIQSRLASETDIENLGEYYSRTIEKLEKENNIPRYVNVVYDAAYCDWFLAYYYQDSAAYEEGYNYLLHLQDAYLGLVDSGTKDRILELKEAYESLQAH